MVTRSEGLLYEDGQGYSKLDAASSRDRLDGYAVVSGLGVTVDSGLTLSVASGEATVGQTSGSVDTVTLGSSDTVTLDAADSSLPRKDTVYIDASGNIQATAGTPQAAEPSGNTRDNTYVPEPPFPATEGTILAEVWVAAGETTLQSADIRDRRAPADVVGDRAVVDEVQSDLVSTEQADTKVFNDVEVNAGWSDFATIQDAIDFADNNGYPVVSVPPGTYDETITVRTNIDLIGRSASGSDSVDINPSSGSPTVEMGNNAEIEQVRIQTATSSDTAVRTLDNLCRVTDCRFGDDLNYCVETNHVATKIEGCDMGTTGDVLFDTNSQNCLIDSCTRVGTVTDNGTNNSPNGGNS